MGLFDNFNFNKLKEGLSRTRNKIVTTINETITGRAVLDDKTLDEIEEILITSDIGYDTAVRIMDNARIKLRSEKERSGFSLIEAIKHELKSTLGTGTSVTHNISQYKPYVILIIGVNGAGKTTTIGKLAHNFKEGGLKVIVGAADTFRAAANEQLEIWAQRAGVDIVQGLKGSDPSSVAYDTVKKAVEMQADVVLIDTAGRLHTKSNLMEELSKIKRVISKIIPDAPHETLLVLDGTTGQNAIVQAEEFSKVTDVNGLIITKLDGTAKGGVVFQISNKMNIPVKYIGVGETLTDLQTFDPNLFVSALFEN